MRTLRYLALASITMVVSAGNHILAETKPCPALKQDVGDPKFQPGQIWSYQTRRGEEASTLTILRIDSSAKLGTIVHVRVDGLNSHNPRGELVPAVLHMPFDRDALLASVDRLLKSNQLIPTLEGLERWQSDCGGVYTITVRTAVAVMEKTLNAP